MITVTKKFEFEAAHYLPDYDGLCGNLHGHSYKMEVEVEKGNIEDSYMVIDFSRLKSIVVDNILHRLDHGSLNDIVYYPTVEQLLLWVVKQIKNHLPTNIYLRRVSLWETSSSYATWYKE